MIFHSIPSIFRDPPNHGGTSTERVLRPRLNVSAIGRRVNSVARSSPALTCLLSCVRSTAGHGLCEGLSEHGAAERYRSDRRCIRLDPAASAEHRPLRTLNKELANVCAVTIVDAWEDKTASLVFTMGASMLAPGGNGPDTSYEFRYRPPPLDCGYVPGVENADRAEHAIVAALQASQAGVRTAPRIGVCAVGGSGKTTTCAGVAACEWVRTRFSKGTVWVQFDTSSTLQTVAEAVVALVYRFCGADAAKRLATLSHDKDFVAVASSYMQSVRVVDAAEWLVVIDDVLHKNRELLRQLLGLIPPSTPVLISTRSEAVVASVPGAILVSIDALPVDDALLVLAAATGKAAAAGKSPFSAAEEAGWVRPVLIKTECHALSLTIVGSMIGVRGGAWKAVVEALEHRWMDPDFWCSDSDSPRPSVRATLDVSLGLLPDGVCREAFAAMGVLPTYVPLPVLARLWQTSLFGAAAAGCRSATQSNSLSSSGVEQLVDELVGAGLLRRDVDKSSGKLVGVDIHPVVGQYALSLLGDAVRATHQRMVDNYMGGVVVDGLDVHAWRQLPFWEVPDDGYWYNHVVRHLAAAGDVCGLVSAMDPAWRAARVRVSSPLAFQADVEEVLSALTVVVGGTTPEAVRSPVLLGRVNAALALTHAVRNTESRRTNMEAAIVHWNKALVLVTKLDAPALWADLQAGCGRAYRVRVDGSRAANIEETIACYHRALEVRTREAVPLKWAETQSNLGAAHVDRVVGDKATNVEAAIDCYKDALIVRTRAVAPLEWASTQNSLGAAYSRRIDGGKAANVEAAITCYGEALTVYTRSAAPLWWARIRYNLGIAYCDRLVGDKAATIEAAIACYNDALTVRTREAAPLQWAATQHHLGKAHRDRLFGDRASNVAAAAACFDRALTMRTRAAVPLQWAERQYHIGVMHHGRYEGSATAAVDLDAAVACYRLALEVRTSEAAPQEWALTSFSLLMAFVDGERWSAAVECGQALERFGPRWAAWPAQHAAVTSAIAEAKRVLA